MVAPAGFAALLERLREQHEIEVEEAIHGLKIENLRLSQELLEIRGDAGYNGNGTYPGMGSTMSSKAPPLPPTPGGWEKGGEEAEAVVATPVKAAARTWQAENRIVPAAARTGGQWNSQWTTPPPLRGSGGPQTDEALREAAMSLPGQIRQPPVPPKSGRTRRQKVEEELQEESVETTSPVATLKPQESTITGDLTPLPSISRNQSRGRSLRSRTQHLDDVLSKVTGFGHAMSEVNPVTAFIQTFDRMVALNIFVTLTIICSFFTMGVSQDVKPDWKGWAGIEMLVAAIFVFELVVRVRVIGCRDFVRGDEWYWNFLDTVVCLTTCFDVVITLMDAKDTYKNATRLSLALRSIRVIRIAPLLRRLDVPYLSNLTSMFTGLAIGIPWLTWVTTVLCLFVYILGIICRQLFGPADEDKKWRSVCGDADFVFGDRYAAGQDPYEGECRVQRLYGEEYFGTVPDSMFTIFRCILGDCTSKGGQSLAPHFGFGYGWRFYIVYCIGLIVVVFGLFNTITAIFVESTMTGLKYNDAQKNYAQKYEANYLRKKLETLVARIREICAEHYGTTLNEDSPTNQITIEADTFSIMLRDRQVRNILKDLDIELDNRQESALYDLFDVDHEGKVTLYQFLELLKRMRGEITKCDIISTLVHLRNLNAKVKRVEERVQAGFASQRHKDKASRN